MDMKGVEVGMVVMINRSDGRVHEATVMGLDAIHKIVKVEWIDLDNQGRCKEFSLQDIYRLNPKLALVKDSDLMPPPARPAVPVKSRPVPSVAYARVMRGSESSVGNSVVVLKQDPLPQRSDLASRLPVPRAPSDSTTSTLQLGALPEHPTPALPAAHDGAAAATTTTTTTVGNAAAAGRRRTTYLPETDKASRIRTERAFQNQQQDPRDRRLRTANGPHWEFLKMIQEYRANLDYRPLSISDQVEERKICVCVRKRPLNKKELAQKEIDVVTVPSRDVLMVHEPKHKVDLTKYLENQTFRFDYAFDESTSNEIVYKFTAYPLVQSIFNKGMATCFAYGQTGSGKTHTMGGNFIGRSQDCTKGIYAMATRDVFDLQGDKHYRHLNLHVYATFFEIYSGKVFDLLNKRAPLRILEDSKQQVQVVGLIECPVSSSEEVLALIETGSKCRTSGQTSANATSSRSHAIFQLILRRGELLHGKFSLVDLAGSERGADTGNSDLQMCREGAEINKSLLALKECIRALGQNKAYTPFRGSKLTQVLRDSFIGENSRTCMIAMISPAMSSCDHTNNTLRYADRVKELGVEQGGEERQSAPLAPTTAVVKPEPEDDVNMDEAGEKEAAQPRHRRLPSLILEEEMPLWQPSEESLLQPLKNKIIEQHQVDLQRFLLQLSLENQLHDLWSQGECSTLDFAEQVIGIIDDRSARDAALREMLQELVEMENTNAKP
ncbi:kinesin-like protein KIF2A isoform X2 [Petromyzon marinus]|uniref:kinesin-like protein KIF2A isoform X2 n=1 Tax=Petromyzon marinus TaxID=7757 RepID=UPI003F718B73